MLNVETIIKAYQNKFVAYKPYSAALILRLGRKMILDFV